MFEIAVVEYMIYGRKIIDENQKKNWRMAKNNNFGWNLIWRMVKNDNFGGNLIWRMAENNNLADF